MRKLIFILSLSLYTTIGFAQSKAVLTIDGFSGKEDAVINLVEAELVSPIKTATDGRLNANYIEMYFVIKMTPNMYSNAIYSAIHDGRAFPSMRVQNRGAVGKGQIMVYQLSNTSMSHYGIEIPANGNATESFIIKFETLTPVAK